MVLYPQFVAEEIQETGVRFSSDYGDSSTECISSFAYFCNLAHE
jgi:hypothetical protein